MPFLTKNEVCLKPTQIKIYQTRSCANVKFYIKSGQVNLSSCKRWHLSVCQAVIFIYGKHCNSTVKMENSLFLDKNQYGKLGKIKLSLFLDKNQYGKLGKIKLLWIGWDINFSDCRLGQILQINPTPRRTDPWFVAYRF